MKPNQRIHAIKIDLMSKWLGQMTPEDRKVFETEASHAQMWVQATIQYLDETWEENQTALKKLKEDLR